MEKLNNLEKTVRKILKNIPNTRGSDDLLYLHVLDEMKVDVSKYDVESFILNYRRLGIPTIETVGRCRRKIQAKNETLKPTPDIQLKRREVENSFYNYSLGYKEI